MTAGGSDGVDGARRRVLSRLAACGLAGLTAALPPAGAALAAAGSDDPDAARRIPLQPMTLPGRDRLSLVRLEAQLVVRKSKAQVQEVETVRTLLPRITGSLLRTLSDERFTTSRVSARQVTALKARIRDIANGAVGAPLIEEVLIVSLLVT